MASRTSIACLALLCFAGVATPVPAADLCKSRVEGSGTGRGAFGKGSRLARERAIDAWETSAAVRFGPHYAHFDHAVELKWNCRSGLLLAKCVVTAVACK